MGLQFTTDVTMEELFEMYRQHCLEMQKGKDEFFKLAALRACFRPWLDVRVDDFGPVLFKNIRRRMLTGNWKTESKKTTQRWSRAYCNNQIRRLKRIYKFALSEQVVSVDTCNAMQAIPLVPVGASHEDQKVEGISLAEAELLRPHIETLVWDIIQVQWYGGMRPSEACNMSVEEVDLSREESHGVWVYNPKSHKTSRFSKPKSIVLGPQAIRILRKHLTVNFKRFFRTPRTAKISVSTYANRIDKGFRKAEARGIELKRWSPNQLRHGRATDVDGQYGCAGFEAITGDHIDMRRVYVGRNLELAMKIARETG